MPKRAFDRPMSGVLALMVAALVSVSPARGPVRAQAPQGIACDPDLRAGNPACTSGTGAPLCRRFGGSCGPFGVLDWACLDDPRSSQATAPAAIGCELVCSGSVGVCEDRVVACNTDLECRADQRCLDGVCTFFVPPPPPGPQCTTDAQCGAARLCVDEVCVAGECRGDWECRTDEACVSNRCAPRCADDEIWVPNPIGSPPIPLGRCQKTAELIECCYDTGSPFQRCGPEDEACPVNQACSPAGVCYRICGDGPCPGELPRPPDLIPDPDRWLELSKPPKPRQGETPILWRDLARGETKRRVEEGRQ